MKKAIEMLSIAVLFLLSAITIVFSITYFNRSKDSATKNADGILSIVEGFSVGIVDVEKYNGKSVQGSVVISIIESLPSTTSATPVLVYTNGGANVAEYTQSGATAAENIDFNAGVYAASTKPTEATKSTGNYPVKTDVTYINPTQYYTIKCVYTGNKTLAYVMVTQN